MTYTNAEINSIKYIFSSAVFHSRDNLGFTQQQVAEAVNISVRWYQRIEKGERFPNSIVFLRIVLFLDIDLRKVYNKLINSFPIIIS